MPRFPTDIGWPTEEDEVEALRGALVQVRYMLKDPGHGYSGHDVIQLIDNILEGY